MIDSVTYIRPPPALSDQPLIVESPPLYDDEFAAHQSEFIQHMFGRGRVL
jgi:hypothetical protein